MRASVSPCKNTVSRESAPQNARVHASAPIEMFFPESEYVPLHVLQSARAEIHQEEGEIVEDIDGRKAVVEFQCIEQHRLAVDLDDVPEMQVAMAVANEPAPRSFL